MDKFEEFKNYCKDKEYLKDYVKEGKFTWQELYEIYDIYGPEADEFKTPADESNTEEESENSEAKTESAAKEENKTKKEGLGGIFDLISGFDADKIQEGLNGMKKILAVLGEISKPEESDFVSQRSMKRPYQRNDD